MTKTQQVSIALGVIPSGAKLVLIKPKTRMRSTHYRYVKYLKSDWHTCNKSWRLKPSLPIDKVFPPSAYMAYWTEIYWLGGTPDGHCIVRATMHTNKHGIGTIHY